jgi:hypothetical protein
MIESPDTALVPYLESTEMLLWSGQPASGIRLRAQDAFLIPFSLLWCGFAIFWEFTAVTQVSKAPGPVAVIFPLWGIPFVLFGLYFVFGRFIADSHCRARTSYGVTSERIVIVSGLFSQQVKSLQLRTVTDVSLTQRPDGSGTIVFGAGQFSNSFFPSRSWPGTSRYGPPSFEMIGDAKVVYETIRAAQKATGNR